MNDLPGQRTGYTASPRDIWLSSANRIFLPGGIVIDASFAIDGSNTLKTDELRAGCLMAQISASGLWVPMKRTRMASGGSGSGSTMSSTTIVVEDARFFKAGETITLQVDDVVTTRVIDSINYSTNVITLTAAVDDVAAGTAVYTSTLDDGTTDAAGCETARAVLNKTVRLLSDEPYNTTWYDKVGEAAISGYLDEDMILGDLTAARADTNARLSGFLWGDRQGQS